MSGVLTRARLIAQERYDLEDFAADQNAIRTDSKFWTKRFLSGENYIVKGFAVSGIGLKNATVSMDQATLLHGENTFDFSWFTSPIAFTDIIVADAALQDGAKNYLEIKLVEVGGTPVTKAFWDPAANGGVGAEFNQEINTTVDLDAQIEVSVGGFSGNPDRIPLAIVEVDGSGNIVGIRDKRKLYYSLEQSNDSDREFTWATQESPTTTLNLSSVVGLFTVGEIITFSGGATAEVAVGGGASIEIRYLDSDSFAEGNTLLGGSSGATATLDQYVESFINADKDISDSKENDDAIKSEIKALKGTRQWYQSALNSITGLAQFMNSQVVSEVEGAQWRWNGTNLSLSQTLKPEITNILAVADVAGSLDAKVFLLQDENGSVAFWIDIDDSGTAEPAAALAADRSVEITTIATGDAISVVASKLATAVGADAEFSTVLDANDVQITDDKNGPRTAASDVDTGFTLTRIQKGLGNTTPADADTLSKLRLFGSLADLDLTRQDGSGGSVSIPIADNEIMFIKLPASGASRTYSGIGAADTNFQVVSIDSFIPADNIYWIAYRENDNLYVRGTGHLGTGDETNIGGGVTDDTLSYIGASGPNDALPDYFSSNIITQNANLTFTISELDVQVAANLAAIAAAGSSSNQDRTLKLIKGGTYSWDLGTTTLTWSADANIQVPDLLNSVNTITAGSNAGLDADGKFLYVDINRVGPGGAIVPAVGIAGTHILTDNHVVIARRVGTDVLVGSSSFLLKDGEFLELDGALAEINRYFGQFQIKPHDSNPDRVLIAVSEINKLNSSVLTQAIEDNILQFQGAQVDFAAGEIRSLDGVSLIDTFTPFAIPSAEYFYYALGITAGTLNATTNSFPGEVVVTPADASHAAAVSAPFATFPTDGLKIGQVIVQEDGGGALEDITFNNIRQLGVGSGSGGGGSVKVIEDRVEVASGFTVTFPTASYTVGKTGIKFFRNGVKMNKVTVFSTVVDDESYAQEYIEGAGPTSSDITIHPDFEAGLSGDPDLFEMCNIQNTFEDFGLAEKIFLQARGTADGSETVNATVTTEGAALDIVTRLTILDFNFNPNFNTGRPLGDLMVIVNGQCAERLVAGVNDNVDNIIYQEDVSGAYVDVYKVTASGREALPADYIVKVYKVQYRVAELEALATHVAPAVDNLYDNGTAGNGWRTMFAHIWAGSLIPDADNLRDLGSALKRWRDLYISGGSIKMNDGTDDFIISMQGGRGGFTQQGEAFKEFGSVDDEAILGAEDTQTFIKKVLMDAPNTSIINRAQIEDPSNSLKSISPFQSSFFSSIAPIVNEYGPAGEVVYEVNTRDSNIRMYGAGWVSEIDHGTHATTSAINDVMEVSFFGTELNLYVLLTVTARDIRATVDLNPEGGNIYPAGASSILAARGYQTRQKISVASGLTPGFHTVKLRTNVALNHPIYGIEVINENTQSVVKQGKAFSGLTPLTLTSDTNLPFKPAAYVGTKGARVKNYIDPSDGVAKQLFTNVDATALFLGASDHSNEEEIREGGIPYNEFGANRSDDFSTTGTKARSFTLGDNSTTLIGGSSTRDLVTTTGVPSIFNDATGNEITLTVECSGLDIFVGGQSTGVYDADEIFVDGVSIGTIVNSPVSRRITLFSGKDYGSHTIIFKRLASAGNGLHYSKFIPFQPKTPTLPAGAVELLDYNVPADVVAISNSNRLREIAQGTVRHSALREFVYSGTWVAPVLDVVNFLSGFNIFTNTASSYVEHTFDGIGCDFRFDMNISSNITFAIDGSNDFSSLTTTFSSGGSAAFVPSTGIASGAISNQFNSSLLIEGLAPGKHVIRMTFNSGANGMRPQSVDVIPSIHINRSSFKGSDSSIDSRNFSFIKEVKPDVDLGKAKAWINFNQKTNTIESSLNISSVIDLGAGQFYLYFEQPFKDRFYVATGSSIETIGVGQSSQSPAVGGVTSGYCVVSTANGAGSLRDMESVTIAFFGELAEEGEE